MKYKTDKAIYRETCLIQRQDRRFNPVQDIDRDRREAKAETDKTIGQRVRGLGWEPSGEALAMDQYQIR